MTNNFTKLFEPIKIGSLELKNRYVMNAMRLGFEKDGFVKKRTIDFYRERARGGVGLIIAGGLKVEKIAYGQRFLSIEDDTYLGGLRKLTEVVQREGAKIFAQLMHAGRYVHSSEIGQQAVSASAVRSRLTGEKPRPLSVDEIKKLVDKYAEAAARARNAGFDGVEIIASTGYLISQFLSPLTNNRDDEYGGNLDNRMRFGLEIAEAVKASIGHDYPVIFRISGNDFMKGGTTNKEARLFARELEQLGIDGINVQSGWHEANIPTVQQIVPPGCFVYLAGAIKKEVSCPVMTSNKLGNPCLAEEILRDGLADLIGMARPFLADPYIPQKVQEGRVDEIVHCISCNQGCLDRVFADKPVTCMVNPFVGREGEWKIAPVQTKKKILVIGGGPGGMAAAKIAAMRGHEVLLYEKSEELGGQIKLAAKLPAHREFGMLINDLRLQLIKNGVYVKKGVEVTPDIIGRVDPDAVVLATGAKEKAHSIPGVDRRNVITTIELFEKNVEIGRNVAIIGGGALGCEAALFLANKGTISSEILAFLFRMEAEDIGTLRRLSSTGFKEITLITRKDRVGEKIGQTTRWIFLQEFRRLNVKIITRVKNLSVTENGVSFEVDGVARELQVDTVIISTGMQPIRGLYESLKDGMREVYIVGDAKKPRKAIEAIREGAEVGITL